MSLRFRPSSAIFGDNSTRVASNLRVESEALSRLSPALQVPWGLVNGRGAPWPSPSAQENTGTQDITLEACREAGRKFNVAWDLSTPAAQKTGTTPTTAYGNAGYSKRRYEQLAQKPPYSESTASGRIPCAPNFLDVVRRSRTSRPLF